jgi:hypothetical protein
MSLSRISRRLVGALAATTLAAAPLSAQSFSQGPDGGPLYGFGAGSAPTIGQSFVASGPFLTGFSFWLSNEASLGTGDNTPDADQITFQAYLAEWDGTAVVGPLLFGSGLSSGPVSPSQRYTFAMAPLAVTSGTQYIAFLVASNLSPIDASAAVLLSGADVSGGQGFFGLSGDINALVNGGAAEWQDLGGQQLGFAATFSQSATVPEPSTGVLLSGAVVLLVAAARRRQAATRA